MPTDSTDQPVQDFASHERQRVRIDGRFLLLLILGCCALGAGAHFLHAVQMDRNAQSLLDLAEQARLNGDAKKEADFFVQYLRFRPGDQDARLSLANAYARVSRTRATQAKVLQLLETVLRDSPDREDVAQVRRRAVDLSIALRAYTGALIHIANLKLDDPNYDAAELAFLEGRCEAGTGGFRQAALKYLQAIQLGEKEVKYYVRLAQLLQAQEEALPRQSEIEESVPKLDAEFKSWFPKRVDEETESMPVAAKVDNAAKKKTAVEKNPATKKKGAAEKAKLVPASKSKPKSDDTVYSTAEIVEKIYNRMAGIRGDERTVGVPGKGVPRSSALLARSRFYLDRSAADDLKRAREDVEEALRLAPNDAEVIRHAAELSMTQANRLIADTVKTSDRESTLAEYRKKLKNAEDLAKKGRELASPDNLQFFSLLAEIKRKGTYAAEKAEQKVLQDDAENIVKEGLEAISEYRIGKGANELSPEEADELLTWQTELQMVLVEILLKKVPRTDGAIDPDALKNYQAELEKLAQLGAKSLRLGVYYAQTLMFQEKWQDALKVLTAARRRMEGNRAARRRLDLAIAECHRQLNNTTGRIQALRSGLNIDATWHQGRLMLAILQGENFQFADATQNFQILLRQNIKNAIIPALRMQVRQQSVAAPEKRNLSSIRRGVEAASKLGLDAVALELLRLELINLDTSIEEKTRFRAMRDHLESALKLHPENAELLVTQARLELVRPDRPPEIRAKTAFDRLREAEKKASAPFLVVLTQAELAHRLPKADARKTLDAIKKRSEPIDKTDQRSREFSKSERHRLLRTLADSYDRAGFPGESVDCLRQIAREATNNVQAQLDVALRVLNTEEAQRQLRAIRAVEGLGGAWGNYLEAIMLVDAGARKEQKQLDALSRLTKAEQEFKAAEIRNQRREEEFARAHRLLTHATRRQPRRPEFWHLLGRVARLMGDRREEAENYERAIELGDRSSVAFATVYMYKSSKNDMQGAGEILERASRTAATLLAPGGKLAHIGLMHAFHIGEVQRLRRFIPEDGRNYFNNVALGLQCHLRYRRLSEEQKKSKVGVDLLNEARSWHEKAVQVGHESPLPWIALVEFLIRIDQPKEAVEVIKRAQKTMPRDRRAFTAARCYTLLRDFTKAETLYLQAIKDNPNNAGLMLDVARFYIGSGSQRKAQPLLRKLTAEGSKANARQKQAARHLQSIAIASRGRYSDIETALKMLDSLDRSRLSDLLTRVKILQRSPLKRDRRELIKVLRRIDERKPLTAANRYQLARLFEMTGNWKEAQATITKLLETFPQNRIYLSWYAGAILRNLPQTPENLKLAREQLARLSNEYGSWVGTAALEARILHAEQRPDEETARPLLQWTDRYLLSRNKLRADEAARVKLAAEVCEELKLFDAAESILKRYGKLSERPENALSLATFYGRRMRYDDGLRLCQQSVKTCSPDAIAVTAANVVALGKPTMSQRQTAEKMIKQAMQPASSSLRIQAAYASILTTLGRLEESEQIYRRIHKQAPNSIAMANNLAWVLAMRSRDLPKPAAEKILEDAITAINDAIDRTGPLAELLDTRALVHLNAGDPKSALVDLKAAIIEDPREAVYHFRLAQAQIAVNQPEAARKSVNTANSLGLSLSILHLLEHASASSVAKSTGVNIR